MNDTRTFPNDGYEVVVCRRQDILDCIDENIIDKEIALSIINHCERVAADFINAGKWVGLPYIGNVRVPKIKQLENTPEQQALIKEAKENLDKQQFIMFRKQLVAENAKQVKHNRYYKYVVSIIVNKYRYKFRQLVKDKGELYARIYLFTLNHILAVDNEYDKYNRFVEQKFV